jgi:hypothetical protein
MVGALWRCVVIMACGVGSAILAAFWLACTGTNNVLSQAILFANTAFSLRDWRVWLLLGAVGLVQNRRRCWPSARIPKPIP